MATETLTGFELDRFVYSSDATASTGDKALNANFSRFRQLFGDVISAEEFGVSENNPDNTEAIQDAINVANARGGGIVLLPEGTLAFSTTSAAPSISIPSNVTLRGRGMGVTILQLGVIDGSRSGFDAIAVPSGNFRAAIRTASGASRVVLEDFTIDGQGESQAGTQNQAQACLVAIASSSNVSLRRVEANNAWNETLPTVGARAANFLSVDSSDVEFVDCRADGSGYELIGMRGTNTNIRIIGGVYGKSRVHGLCPQPGSNGVLIQGVYVLNDHDYNDSPTYHPDALCCHNAHNVKVIGCHLSTNGGAGRAVHILDGSTNVRISNCLIESGPDMQDIGGNAVVHVDGVEGSGRGVWDLHLDNCRIITRHTTRACISLDRGDIHGYTISNCSLEAPNGARAIYMVRNSGAKSTNIRLLNNNIETAHYVAAEVWTTAGIEGFQFVGNRVSFTPSSGAGLNPQVALLIGNSTGSDWIDDVLIAGNTILMLDEQDEVDGIRFYKAENVRVIDNLIQVGPTGDAIEFVSGCEGAIVRGNVGSVLGTSTDTAGVYIGTTGNSRILVDGNDFSALTTDIKDTGEVATVGTNL